MLEDEKRLIAHVERMAEELLSLTNQLSSFTNSRTVGSTRGPFKFDGADRTEPGAVTEAQLAHNLVDPLPDPRLVRRIIRYRQMRAQHFGPDLFADPVWDMLLDLAAARAEHRLVSVTSLCIASGVPSTTALRYIGVLEELGLIERTADARDRRRRFVALSRKGALAMARYFADVARQAGGSP